MAEFRADTVSSLWDLWTEEPENWDSFIHEVDLTLGPGITEDLYNLHDDWDRDKDG